VVTAGILLAAIFLTCPCTFALNPELDVSQYAHTPWKFREGFVKGDIHAIAQTPDGYLWLGTEYGLVRFDGVRYVPWQPPADQHLPSNDVTKLLTARDGTLWIGTRQGLASWKGGKLTRYGEPAGQAVDALLEDHEGSIWVGGYSVSNGELCVIRNGSARCFGEDGVLGHGVFGLHEDHKGGLWVGVPLGLWRWKPGPPKFYPMPGEVDGIRSFGEDTDGGLLIDGFGGIKRFNDGKAQAYPIPDSTKKFRTRSILRDRDGGLWIGTAYDGLVHVHQGRADVFGQAEGLSSDRISGLFEDREGDIWAVTANGLDRFRDYAVATFTGNQGLSSPSAPAILADRDGSIWLNTADGINRLNHGEVTAYRERQDRSRPKAPQQREIVGSGLPDHGAQSLFQDDRGRIWIATLNGVGYLENNRFVLVPGIPGGIVHQFTEDTQGNLWIANQELGLFRLSLQNLSPESKVQRIPNASLGRKDPVVVLDADPLQGGLWLGFYQSGVANLADGQIRASYSSADGLGAGRVNHVHVDRDGAVWAATAGGLSRIKDGRIATLTSKNGLPCDSVVWMMEDDAHSVWMNTACGLVRVPRPELDAWVSNPGRTIKASVFDGLDGVRSHPEGSGYTPQVAKTPDGRLWFLPVDGVSMVDPNHLPFNQLPPPVNVETVKVNGKELAADQGLQLSHSGNDLEIDYTAPSLAIPERVRFRYKLEGKDADWQDVGTRRQAYYGGLAPKRYRFRVMARNSDGVWNEAGAAWDFSIAPAYYQTIWFQALEVFAGAGFLWLLYRLRLRQVTARVNLLYNERLAERTRIARDLHDTLLQSLAGVSLQLDGISKQAATHPERTPSLIARVREQVDSAFREARVKVWNLRSTALEAQGLEGALRQLVERLGSAITARCESSLDLDIAREHRQQDDPSVGEFRPDRERDVDAAKIRKPKIRQGDIGPELAMFPDPFLTAGSRAHQPHVGLVVNQTRDSFAEQRVIIDA